MIKYHLRIDDQLLVKIRYGVLANRSVLDTPTTLRGGVNECGALFPKTSLLHKNSSISIQHLFITHCCHL
jgi:hypothetical protein